MEVRRTVILEVHLDYDPEEAGYLGHAAERGGAPRASDNRIDAT